MNVFAGVMCLIVLLFLFFRENNRKDKRRIGWRMAATFVAILGIYLLLVPVRCKQKRLPTGNVAILLTPDFSMDTLDFVLKENPGAVTIDESSLWKINNDFETLHIIGSGISFPVDESALPGNVIFHPTLEKEATFVAIDWNRKLMAGEPLIVQGSYRNQSGGSIRLLLSGFSTIADSVAAAKGVTDFTLTAKPAINGRGVYRILAMDGTDTLENNAIPFEVINSEKPALLLLSAYPDFENRFLIDWLSASQYKVMSRTRISKQKFEKNFYNTPARAINQVNAGVLDSTDVVIIDEEELKELNTTEKNLLRKYLSNNSIGLMIRADSASGGRQLFTGNKIIKVGSFNNQRIAIEIKGRKDRIVLWNSGISKYLNNGANTVSMIRDSAGHSLAGVAMYGKGRIVYNAMPPVFPLMISGEKKSYELIWSTLLQQTTPFVNDHPAVFLSAKFPQVNMPNDVIVKTSKKLVPELYADEKPFALQQHEWLSGHYSGTYWPVKTGWQNVFVMGDEKIQVYIFDSTDWKNIRMIESNNSTKKLINHKRNIRSLEKSENDFSAVPLSPVYWLVLFILGSGYLWIERKIP